MNLVDLALFVVVLAAVVFRQVSGRGPPVWSSFALGALAVPLLGLLSIGGTWTALEGAFPVIVFLAGLFVFAAALDRSGAIDYLARWFLGQARRPEDIPLLLFVGFGLLSAVIVNDALVLVGAPLVLTLSRRLDVDARPLLLTLAFSVTVGSVLTPFGNPQNLLVALGSGIGTPVLVFLRYLAVPTALNLILGGLLIRRFYGRRLAAGDHYAASAHFPRIPLLPAGSWGHRIRDHPVLGLFPATLATMIAIELVAQFRPVPSTALPIIAGVGALVLLAVSPGRTTQLRGVNLPILILFAGLFVVVAAAVQGGALSGTGLRFPLPSPANLSGSIPLIVATGLLGSQVVSNVPWVALQIPLLQSAGFGAGTPVAWMALAGGSTLGGCLTFLGAASNLIVVDRAERAHVPLNLWEFSRVGLPLGALTAGILVLCLLGGV